MTHTDYASLIRGPFLVTLSGNPGSGKSTATKGVCNILGAERVYAGQFMRDMALARGMLLEEFIARAKDHPEVDREIDGTASRRAMELYGQGKIVIAEGRTQFHFLPEALSIYIHVREEEGARRIFEDLNSANAAARNQSAANAVGEVLARNRERETIDAERYSRLYGVDHRNLNNYNRVIDSTSLTKDQVVDNLLRVMWEYQQANSAVPVEAR